MTAAAIVKAYNLIGYNAVCVGSQDLIAGLPYLLALSKDAKFAWLSANLVHKSTKKHVFKASTSIKLGNIKVGVIGLTGPTILSASDEAILLPWDQILPDLIAKMSKTNDLLILLSNLPTADNQKIAEAYSAIHLIIESGASANTISPKPINNTLMASTGPQGKQIGIMEINWQGSKHWRDQAAEAPIQEKDAALSKGINKRANASSEPSTYTNRFLAMEKDMPDQPEISHIVKELDAAINKLGQLQAQSSAAQVNSPYLGFRGCGACHAPQMSSWQQTKHANAYRTLAQANQQFNQDCLPCHVTGVALSQAAEALSLPDDRRGVGCETCHGAGRLHSENPKTNPMTSKPGADLCLNCHSAPHDKNFQYDERLKIIGHK